MNGMNRINERNEIIQVNEVNLTRRYGRHEVYDIRNYPYRNRHRYNARSPSSIDFRGLIGLTLTNSILQDPLFQFTNIIKKNAANKIIKWYKKMKLKKQFIDR
jgi:hypothetical protein